MRPFYKREETKQELREDSSDRKRGKYARRSGGVGAGTGVGKGGCAGRAERKVSQQKGQQTENKYGNN